MNNRFIATWIFSFWAFISRSSVLATRRWFREMLLNLSIIQSATLSNNFLINFKIYVNFSSLESEGEKIIKISRYVYKSQSYFKILLFRISYQNFPLYLPCLFQHLLPPFKRKQAMKEKCFSTNWKNIIYLLNQNKPYSTEHAGQHLWHSKLNVVIHASSIHIKITIY